MKIRCYFDEQTEVQFVIWNEKKQKFLYSEEAQEAIRQVMSGVIKETALATDFANGKDVPEQWTETSPLWMTPSKIICLGKSYSDHAKEFDGDAPDEPAVFLKANTALTSWTSPVLNPPGCTKLDYEVELAVVLARPLKNATEEEARKAIAGYTLMCDYSERAYQLERGGQWTKGKSYDTFAPVGPSFITAEELGDAGSVPLWLKVNGELRQHGNSGDLIWPIPRMVAYVSHFMSLLPGDLISTGTPGGVGMGMTPPRYLKSGDWVEWGSPLFGSCRQIVQNDES